MSWNQPSDSWGTPTADPTACDPTFEVCDSPADNSTSSANATNQTNDTVVVVDATNTTAPVTAANATEPAKASTLLWGILSTAQLGAGYYIYNQYDTMATNLLTTKSSTYQTSNWATAAWIKTQAPFAMWVNTSYAVMGMQSVSVLAWLSQMLLGFDGLFLKLYTLALLYPIIQIGLAVYTYTSYTTCATAVATYWTGGTTTQVVSCSTYAAQSYIPTTVNDDPYQTVTGATSGGAFLLLLFSLMRRGKFQAAFGGDAITEDNVDEVAADSKYADDSAPADDSTPAPADSTPAPADSTPADSTADSTPADSTADSTAVEPDNTTPADDNTAADPWNSGS